MEIFVCYKQIRLEQLRGDGMLMLEHVSKIYQGKMPYQALEDVSFSVAVGEFVAVMGPSGSGKSTLLNLIGTTDSLSSGEVIVNQHKIKTLSKNELADFRRTSLGFVFQQFHLLDTLTVEENIVLPLTLGRYGLKEMEQRIAILLKRLHLTEHAKKRTYEISGGQAQRAAIGRALIHKPKLVLCDEPTGNLDTKSSKEVLQLLAEMRSEEETTILMVTHDALAASYCDRVLFLKDGKLYNELYRPMKQGDFYKQISNVLISLGGDEDDFSSVRLS